jgi:uncharacterized membrane protein
VTDDLATLTDDHRSVGQRWADAATAFSGSWTFILCFAAVTGSWIAWNVLEPSTFDPYPFLFLNWMLTMVSTFQTPLIMLSQNRQNDVEREHSREVRQQLNAIRSELRDLRTALEK